jgi:hypothetical protein
MSDVASGFIIIGGNYTQPLLTSMLLNNLWFENLCFQTVYIFSIICGKLNIIIYIPILPYNFIRRTQNQPKNDSDSAKPSGQWFSSGTGSSKNTTKKDFDTCSHLADELAKTKGVFHRSVKSTSKDGKRTIVAGETWVPGYGTITHCSDMPKQVAKHVDPDDKIPNVGRFYGLKK